ncbi:LysR family transcriptional regulator [Streptomyces sp. NPDC102437]|uniref:helix-turn-helix domain-containing protein n=1 Tax=Streptomyces sp. NPDC102437 TaxID=3366175 RepID=UPI00382AC39C
MIDSLNPEGLRYRRSPRQIAFGAAARAYGVTQPALSSGIAKLEERLGEELFDGRPAACPRQLSAPGSCL